MHSSTTAQYTIPEVIGPTSPPVTDTMTSSSRAMADSGITRPSTDCPWPKVPKGAEVGIVEALADLSCRAAWIGRRRAASSSAQQRGNQR
jgi:hypothetical protein